MFTVWYDTHNVTQHLRDSPGPRHAVGLTLAPGWDSRHGTGKEGIEVKLRLSIDLEGGSHVDVVSDETWRGGRGPLAAADVYNGETFVANRTTRGWSKPGFNDSGWANASLGKPPHNMSNPKHPVASTIVATHANLPQVEVTGTQPAVDMWQASANSYVFDFGVNRAGVTTLSIPGAVATKLGAGAVWKQQAAEALMCAKPCSINHFPAQGAGAASEFTEYHSDPELNAEDGSGTIDFTPQFAQ